jgi:hypothetical protein
VNDFPRASAWIHNRILPRRRRLRAGPPFYRLSEQRQRDALLAALAGILARQGLDVCRSEWGKHLGGGLAEFRLRHDRREVLARDGTFKSDLPESSPEKILLPVFFHAHGTRLILLLSGYDKGARSNARYQQREIERARAHLKEWRDIQSRQRRP